MEGFWTVDTVASFKAAVVAASPRSTGDGPVSGLRILTDARGMSVQSQDVVNALMASFDKEQHYVSRSAMLVGSALFKLQLLRVTDLHRLFDCEDAALEWLLSDKPLAAAA